MLLINIAGSLMLGFFLVWTTERVLEPAMALDGGNRLLRIIHNFFQLAFEAMSYFEQGHWTLFATNIVANNLLCLVAILVRAMIARNLKAGAERVEFCRKEAQS